jgi:Fur family transcriptional regulator, ferric uptake regulator
MKMQDHSHSITLSSGKRMTKARKEIIALLTHGKPLTIQMMVAKVEANEASVYRTIQLLKSEKAVEEIIFPDGSIRYVLCDMHHHHIVCTGCGYTEHVACGKEKLSMPKSKHFKTIGDHHVTFYGRCTACV